MAIRYKPDTANKIFLGRQGENLAREYAFDFSTWRERYGEGAISLIAQRFGDAAPYPVAITVEGDTAIWTVTNADTAVVGTGKCELRYTVDDVIVKSATYKTKVTPSLSGELKSPPAPQTGWVTKVLTAREEAVGAADMAKDYAIDAERSNVQAQEAQRAAENAAKAAESAKTEAETAKTAAENARDAAESAKSAAIAAKEEAAHAKSDAQNAAASAADSATTASDARQVAENARNDAESAKSSAETAQNEATKKAQEAAASANAASASEQSALSSASTAEEAKKAAETAKGEAEAAATTVSAAAQIINELNAHRYDAFTTETQSSTTEVYTDIGADGVPVKGAVVNVTAGSGTIVLRHFGKNLFDPNTAFAKGIYLDANGAEGTSANHICSDFIAVEPNTPYALSGNCVTGAGVRVYVAFYTADKNKCSDKGRIQSDFDADLSPFTTPANCRFIRFTAPVQRYNNGHISFTGAYGKPVQLARGATVTDYVPYSASDTAISVVAGKRYEVNPFPSTVRGDNTFRLLADEGITATMDVTYRVDPTLAYEKLKAAIVAAGTT